MAGVEREPEPLSPPVSVELTVLPGQPCPYLPGRESVSRGVYAPQLPPMLYHAFMDAGFRRSGRIVYQPVCVGCRECRPLRVLVPEFRPSKSQRRVTRRNTDLEVKMGPAVGDGERYELYRKYTAQWHGGEAGDYGEFRRFLYESPVETIEFSYRLGPKLVAAGVCDVCEQSLSSVYFYFDPDHGRRSLGTYGALVEIEFARRVGIPYYYLGYWVRGSATMAYKANFGPHEVLDESGEWVR